MNPSIPHAVQLLQAGELIGLPTETVYGLGADAANAAAVAKIFTAKGRPADHPVIVHLPGAAHLDRWAQDIPPLAWELAEAFWPGPLTFILKRRPHVSDLITGGQETVGLRVPGHPLALELLSAFAAAGGSGGIAAPSANRFGRISPTTAAHVREELGTSVAYILDGGPCPVGIESTILDLSTGVPRLLRPGQLTPEAIAAVCGILPQTPTTTLGPRVSGSLAAHYAPRTPLKIIAPEALVDELKNLHRQGARYSVLSYHPLPANIAPPPTAYRLLPAAPQAYAKHLYAALRELDQMKTDMILVEAVPHTTGWAAIQDRLRRAAHSAAEKTGS